MVTFINNRPSLPTGMDSIQGYPPIEKALHVDTKIEIYQLSKDEQQTSLFMLFRQTESKIIQKWWQQLRHQNVQMIITQQDYHNFPIASVVQMPGEWVVSRIGNIETETQVINYLNALLDVAANGLSFGIKVDFRPSLLWEIKQDEKILILPLIVEQLNDGDEEIMINDIGKSIYTIATGRNIYELNSDEIIPPFRQWFKSSRSLSRLITRCIGGEKEHSRYKNINDVKEALNDIINNNDSPAKEEAYKTNLSTPIESQLRGEKIKGGMAKVAGMHALKSLLQDEVITPLLNPEPYKRYGLTIPNGILLYGPPGCGKTYIARQLADELGFYFVEVIPSEIASQYIHGSSMRIRDLFETAAEHAPAIIFIDEFEALVPKRSSLGGSQQYKSEEVNEFLAQLNDCSARKIFIIAATNEPEQIDPAIRRSGRLDKLIPVGPPDEEARQEMLRLHLANRPVQTDIDINKIASSLEGYSASDIKMLVDEAARDALANKSEITESLICNACQRVPPSVNLELLNKYEAFNSRGI